MLLEQQINFFNPPEFNLATNTILGTSAKWKIDRTFPIEEIIIVVNFDVTTGWTTTNSTTPDMYDNLVAILKKVNLSINDGQPRTLIDCSGVGLLEYATQTGMNIDDATLRAIAISNNVVGALAVPVGVYQIAYRIPMVDSNISEPLRSRLYLPVHTHSQDPVLTLDFNTLAAMSAVALGAVGTVRVEVILVRRKPTLGSEKMLRETGTTPTGYINWDLVESSYSFPLGSAVETRIPIPTPGNYANLFFRQYKGGAAPLSRNATIDVDTGVTIATNMGQETKWRLESGNVVMREWRWKHLRILNDNSRPAVPPFVTPLTPFVAATSAGSPTSALVINPANFPSGLMSATANFRAGSSTMLDFLGDSLNGERGNELGSTLDCNTPADKGLKMELIGTPASVATNPSVLFFGGRRFFGDISPFQRF